MLDKIEELERRFQELEALLSDPAVIANQPEFRKLSREHADLAPLVDAYRRYRKVLEAMEENRELLADPGSRLKALVVAYRDEEIVRHAGRIKGLDLLLYIGAYTNPFADLAHVVLPAASYAEADGTYTNAERRVQRM